MNCNRLIIAIGCVVFAYWVMFYVYIFKDAYPCNPSMDLLIKSTLPFALVTDIVGVIIGCVVAVKGKLRGVMIIALYGLPLLAGAVFLWWLCFGVKI